MQAPVPHPPASLTLQPPLPPPLLLPHCGEGYTAAAARRERDATLSGLGSRCPESPRSRASPAPYPGCSPVRCCCGPLWGARARAMDVIVLAGQSNMAGRGGVAVQPADGDGGGGGGGRRRTKAWDGVVPSECAAPPGAVLRLSAARAWEDAREPLHFDVCGVGPGLVFAAELLRLQGQGASAVVAAVDGLARKPSAATVGLVPCAIGGSAIDEWSRGGEYYQSMVARTKAALEADGSQLRTVLWYQGESDCGSKELAEGYAVKLESLIAALREDLGCPDLLVFQVGIVTGKLDSTAYLEQLRLSQRKVVVPGLHLVDAWGLELNADDHLHLTTDAQVRLGRSLARAYVDVTRREPP
eukprot:SM000151S01470  [mRNA]  locus=s151:60349:61828:+ [translate_table: standard]